MCLPPRLTLSRLKVSLIAFGLAAGAFAQRDHSTVKPAPTSVAAAATPAAAAAVHGIDPADMDRTCKPCEDFYKYADGGWLKKNAIPPEYPSWGTFSELAERNRQALRQILEQLARQKGPEGSEKQGSATSTRAAWMKWPLKRQGPGRWSRRSRA